MTPPAPTPLCLTCVMQRCWEHTACVCPCHRQHSGELDEIATMLDSVGDEYLNWKRQLFPIARKVQEYVRAREATAHARGREEVVDRLETYCVDKRTDRDYCPCLIHNLVRAIRRPPSPREEGNTR